VLAILGGIIAVILIAIVVWALMALAVMAVIVAACSAASAGVGIFAGFAAAALGASQEAATMIGVGSGLVTFPFLVRAAFKRFQRATPKVQSRASPPVQAAPPASPVPIEPKGDEAVGAAWVLATEIVPASAVRFRQHREGCAALLHAADADGYDPALRDGAVLVRNHVPELVMRTQALLRGADSEDREGLCAELSRSLDAIGAKVADAVAAYRRTQREALAIRHTHVRREPSL
jgi:hypothetical protein